MPRSGTTKKEKLVFWGVPDFPKKIKDEFIWVCKIEGKPYVGVLENLLKHYLFERRKQHNVGTRT